MQAHRSILEIVIVTLYMLHALLHEAGAIRFANRGVYHKVINTPQIKTYAIFCRFASHFTLVVQFSRYTFTADVSFSLTADIHARLLPSTYINLQRFMRVVGSSGLEPPTSRLSGARSNRLSYEPTSELTALSLASPCAATLARFVAPPFLREPLRWVLVG